VHNLFDSSGEEIRVQCLLHLDCLLQVLQQCGVVVCILWGIDNFLTDCWEYLAHPSIHSLLIGHMPSFICRLELQQRWLWLKSGTDRNHYVHEHLWIYNKEPKVKNTDLVCFSLMRMLVDENHQKSVDLILAWIISLVWNADTQFSCQLN
jgi:hypothetical protein